MITLKPVSTPYFSLPDLDRPGTQPRGQDLAAASDLGQLGTRRYIVKLVLNRQRALEEIRLRPGSSLSLINCWSVWIDTGHLKKSEDRHR
jgi:hypothetical protein